MFICLYTKELFLSDLRKKTLTINSTERYADRQKSNSSVETRK